jgi:hypothetical protein
MPSHSLDRTLHSNPNPNVRPPKDHAELLEAAQLLRPDLVGHKHASGCVIAQKPDTKQFVHIPHAVLRAQVDPPKLTKPSQA